MDLASAPRRLDRKVETGPGRGESRADDIGGPEAVGQYLAAIAVRRIDQTLTECVVGVDHADRSPGHTKSLDFAAP